MTKSIHVALLGVTHPHASSHLHTLRLLDEVTQVSLWDEDAAALAALAAAQPQKVQATYTALNRLLVQPDIDIVLACPRTDQSPELCCRALAARKHVLSEKPIGRTPHDIQTVIAAAQKYQRQVGVFYTFRSHPLVCDMRRLLAEGIIGDIMSVEIRMITTQVAQRNPAHWLFNRAQAGGGILSWLGCHFIDMVHFVAQAEFNDVRGHVATRSGEAIDVEDTATASFRLSSGAIGSIHVAYALGFSGGGYVNAGGYDRYIAFNGNRGRMVWDGLSPKLHVESQHSSWRDAPIRDIGYTLAASQAYGGVYGEAFVRQFIVATQSATAPSASATDALRVAEFVARVYGG